jgi:signal transduction histidine kinase
VASPEGVPHGLRLAVPLDRHRATMVSYARLAAGVGALVALALLAVVTGPLRALHRRIAVLVAHMSRLRQGDLAGTPEEDPAGDELAALRDEVAAATEELRQVRDARERLLADAAHELRTPLAAIRTDVDVTLRRERSAGELRETLQRVREETARLGQLAQQLLDLAATGHRAWTVQEGDLASRARASCAALTALAAERGVTLAVRGEARGRFDDDGVAQVLANLLENAIRLSPRGSDVVVDVAREGAALRLAVVDQGPGVPERERALVFEPFHRLRREGGGAGLGLAIVRDVARRHGGDARVEDAPGGGARFVVSWPG